MQRFVSKSNFNLARFFSSGNRNTSRSVWRWGNTSGMAKATNAVGSLMKHSSHMETNNIPERIPGFSNVSAIAASNGHAGFIDSGRLFTYGDNSKGQLGHSKNESCSDPREVPMVEFDGVKEKYVQVSMGAQHTAAISEARSLYTWGYGGSFFGGPGALGLGSQDSHFSPQLVVDVEAEGRRPVEVQCGDYHTVVLNDSGELLVTGNSDMGRLGRGHEGHLKGFESVEAIGFLPGNPKIASFSVAERFNLICMDNGRVYVWGANNKGQLGLDDGVMDMYACERYPKELKALAQQNIVLVGAGDDHSLAVTQQGAVYTWGGVFMQPKLISLARNLSNSLIKEQIVKVDCGRNSSFALTSCGKLYSWGRGGALGRTEGPLDTPTALNSDVFEGEKVVDVTACGDRVLVITEKTA